MLMIRLTNYTNISTCMDNNYNGHSMYKPIYCNKDNNNDNKLTTIR